MQNETPLTDGEIAMIEMTRRLARSLITRLADGGAQPTDIAIGMAYALHDAATELTGTATEAVEWMRTAADIMERSALRDGR